MTLNKPSGWEDWIGTVKQGDCLDLMKQMPEGVVHCVVTSPPYYGLRDYGTAKWEGGDVECDHNPQRPDGGQRADRTLPLGRGGMYKDICSKCGARRVDPQLGLERTPELYVSKMVDVFREVRRIMHPTATLWLNMGDSYASGGGEGRNRYFDGRKEEFGPGNRPKGSSKLMKNTGLKPKDLLEMPSRLVLALQADGWWLRCRIPWLKRNAMPESVQGSRWERHRIKVEKGKERTQKFGAAGLGFRDHSGLEIKGAAEYVDCPGCPKCDPNDGLVLRMSAGRPTQAVEYVFLLQKSPECHYDGEAVRVKALEDSYRMDRPMTSGAKAQESPFTRGQPQGRSCGVGSPSGRSRRNSDWFFESWQGLWTDENGQPLAFIVNPKPYKRAHFATFPPGLVIPCLKAGTSERGACLECGSPWVRIIESQKSFESGSGKSGNPISGKYPEGCQGGGDTGDVRKGPVLQTKTLGWRPTCSCSKEPLPCLAFDPFAGTGTVIEVARKMGRSGLGFEISEEYVKKYCGERLAQGVFDLKTEEV